MKPEDIKSIRLSLGLTQEKFAVKMHVSVQTIARWEKGKQKPQEVHINSLQTLKKTM